MQEEKGYKNKTVTEIVRDVQHSRYILLKGRKNTCVRSSFVATNNKELFDDIRPLSYTAERW